MFYKQNQVFIIKDGTHKLSHFLININDEKNTPLFFYCNVMPMYSFAYKCAEWGMIDLSNMNDYNKKYMRVIHFAHILGEIL
jgi:hypothetical protein